MQGISRIVWKDAQGKPSAIFKGSNVNDDIRYEYDPSGKRLYKGVEGGNGNYIGSYYIRDASGNVISVYQNRNKVDETLPAAAGLDGNNDTQKEFLNKLIDILGFDKVYEYFIAPILGYDAVEFSYFNSLNIEDKVKRIKNAGENKFYIDPNAPAASGVRTNHYGRRYFSLLVEQFLRDHPAIALEIKEAYLTTGAAKTPGSIFCNLGQKEVHLYGSSRLGIDQMDRDTLFLTPSGQYEFIRNPFSANMIIYRKLVAPSEAPRVLSVPSATGKALGDTIGQKRYELSNHLGNVLAIVSDKRIIKGCGQYEAELHQATDYYPFGSAMPGRSITLGNNPAAPSHRKNPDDTPRTDVDEHFKQGKYYAIDGKKTLYLYYPHFPTSTILVDYAFSCTTSAPGVSPPVVFSRFLTALWSIDGLRNFVDHINSRPDMATAVLGQQTVGGVLYDVVAVTFNAGLANVPYDRIGFAGATLGAPLHLFVNPGADDEYRYGFNGKENDNETNSLDFDNRCYDPRVGRWMSEDPKKEKYPEMSPFTAFGNNPLIFIDPDGGEIKITRIPPAAKGGKPTIRIELTAVVIDNTRDDNGNRTLSQAQLQEAAGRILRGIERTYQGQGAQVNWETCVSIKAVSSENEIDKEGDSKDHVFRIINHETLQIMRGDPGNTRDHWGVAGVGQNYAYLSDRLVENDVEDPDNPGFMDSGNPSLERTAAHEFGHNLGEDHPNPNRFIRNIMHQSWVPNAGIETTERQILIYEGNSKKSSLTPINKGKQE